MEDNRRPLINFKNRVSITDNFVGGRAVNVPAVAQQ